MITFYSGQDFSSGQLVEFTEEQLNGQFFDESYKQFGWRGPIRVADENALFAWRKANGVYHSAKSARDKLNPLRWWARHKFSKIMRKALEEGASLEIREDQRTLMVIS